MSKKLWGGRFKKELDADAKEYSYSIHTDIRLTMYDIRVNKAHAKALADKGVLTKKELKQVEDCLDGLEETFNENPAPFFTGGDEDIHSCIERLVTEELGDLGKKLHTGKSRNDQVITDFRLFMMDEVTQIIDEVEELLKTLVDLAQTHLDVVFPGFTHLQTAQPVLFSHHLLAYFEKFSRDRTRFIAALESADVCPLGAAAMAGNNYGLDRKLVAEELHFTSLTRNSMDAVSDRDFLVEFLSSSSLCLVHLSQFCEEFIIWSSPLVGLITIGDDFTTGSSIMPQKKNPDIAELIRGRSARVMGDLTSMFHLIKALPLTYNRDLQEDKVIAFDAVDVVRASIVCFRKMLSSISLNQEAIDHALQNGHLLATEFADYLVKKGVPFREAHELTGQAVLKAEEKGIQVHELSLEDLQELSSACEEDVKDVFTFENAINLKRVLGGTARPAVEQQIKLIKETFKW